MKNENFDSNYESARFLYNNRNYHCRYCMCGKNKCDHCKLYHEDNVMRCPFENRCHCGNNCKCPVKCKCGNMNKCGQICGCGRYCNCGIQCGCNRVDVVPNDNILNAMSPSELAKNGLLCGNFRREPSKVEPYGLLSTSDPSEGAIIDVDGSNDLLEVDRYLSKNMTNGIMANEESCANRLGKPKCNN
jgi:hypothetical protein